MNICILGLGVIGTTYAYAFQKAGHQVEHLVRKEKRVTCPQILQVKLLDGRFQSKGQETEDDYSVALAKDKSSYDFIFVSVRSGKLQAAIDSLRQAEIKGTLVIFCNLWLERQELEAIVGDYPYILAFPTAGGHMSDKILGAVLFDHVMLERKERADVSNYENLVKLFDSAHIKQELPHDMLEWIWLHMAINAGVTSTASTLGDLEDPQKLALALMDDRKNLARAIQSIRETVQVVAARQVNLKLYKNELLPYKIPIWIASRLMKHLFASNELTRRIMTLHNDKNDILYACQEVYQTGLEAKLSMPVFAANMSKIEEKLKE